jgi:hypothetical protein
MMSKMMLGPTESLIRLSVPLARAMLLTDTFKAAGKSAMILEPALPPGAGRPAPGGRPAAAEAEGPVRGLRAMR